MLACRRAKAAERSRPPGISLLVGRAPVRLGKPAIALFGEDTGQSFAIQIDPAMACAVAAPGEVPDAVRIEFVHGFADGCVGVFELRGRKAFGTIAAPSPSRR